MSKPPNIVGTHGHTVSLPEGGNIATRKTARKPDGAPQAPAARAKAPARPAAPAPKAARSGTAKPAASRKSTAQASTLPPDADEPMPLGESILLRIADLQQRNDAVRAQLDRLAASTDGNR